MSKTQLFTAEQYTTFMTKDAPIDLERKIDEAIDLFSQFTTFPYAIDPLPSFVKEEVIKAIMYQIDYMIVNQDMFNYKAMQGFSIGKFSKNGVNASDIENMSEIAPNAYNKLANLGMTSLVI